MWEWLGDGYRVLLLEKEIKYINQVLLALCSSSSSLYTYQCRYISIEWINSKTSQQEDKRDVYQKEKNGCHWWPNNISCIKIWRHNTRLPKVSVGHFIIAIIVGEPNFMYTLFWVCFICINGILIGTRTAIL